MYINYYTYYIDRDGTIHYEYVYRYIYTYIHVSKKNYRKLKNIHFRDERIFNLFKTYFRQTCKL